MPPLPAVTEHGVVGFITFDYKGLLPFPARKEPSFQGLQAKIYVGGSVGDTE